MSVRLSWECGSGHFTANALHPFIKESTESLCACLVAHSWPVVDFSSSSAHEFMVPAGNLAYQSNAVSQRVLTKRRIIKASFPAMPPKSNSPVPRAFSLLDQTKEICIQFRRVRAWLDPVFSPGRVGGEDWQSSSFNGGVLIEKKASPNKWRILMESRFDAGEIHRSG
ncbi:hypothetical protein L3X38_000245 (mitochondrion) [Prunus dulcis]|uniref:Uncharacterized protein n=1 Tax=Prunus dulcis TaxID=3755 RepID=A0AAD4UR40_PRUDU|nr:hypothetical protein L3X38_000245 [Prunus dulcis]